MRNFDTLEPATKIDILSKSVSFAKAEIIANSLPPLTDVVQLALDYCWNFEVVTADFSLINPSTVPAWTGPIPIKVPRP